MMLGRATGLDKIQIMFDKRDTHLSDCRPKLLISWNITMSEIRKTTVRPAVSLLFPQESKFVLYLRLMGFPAVNEYEDVRSAPACGELSAHIPHRSNRA